MTARVGNAGCQRPIGDSLVARKSGLFEWHRAWSHHRRAPAAL